MAERFDTLAASELLEESGIGKEQSECIARVIPGAISGSVSPRQELALCRKDMEKVILRARNTIVGWIWVMFLALIAILKDWSQIFGGS